MIHLVVVDEMEQELVVMDTQPFDFVVDETVDAHLIVVVLMFVVLDDTVMVCLMLVV